MHGAAEVHGNVVPVGEFLGDTAIARRIVFLEIVERRIGEDHAEAEGVVGAVALMDRDLGLRPLLFQEDRGIETGRSAADYRHLHQRLRNRLSDKSEITLSLNNFGARASGSPDERSD